MLALAAAFGLGVVAAGAGVLSPSQAAKSFAAARPDPTRPAPFAGPDIAAMLAGLKDIGAPAGNLSKPGNWESAAGGLATLPGCKGDGIADDTACVQAAIDAHQGRTLYLGTGLYRITRGLVSPGQIILVGSGGGQGAYDATCRRGLRNASGTIAMLTLGGAGSRVFDLCIDAAVAATSGAGIVVGPGTNGTIVYASQINRQFVGIDVSGAADGTQTTDTVVMWNEILPVDDPGASAIRVGARSTLGNTVDNFFENNGIFCNNRAVGILVNDSGGGLFKANTPYGCSYGTRFSAGANQQVIWNYSVSTVLGDTSSVRDLDIDTTAPSAQIRGNMFVATWASSAASVNVRIADEGGSHQVQGQHFVGHRSYNSNAGGTAFDIVAGDGASLDSSVICAGNASNTGTAIRIERDAANTQIRNNAIGGCDNGATAFATGIAVTQATSGLVGIITGNDFAGATTPLVYAPAGGNDTTATITGNIGLDNAIGRVASGAAIVAPTTPTFAVTGKAAVRTIAGGWSGRQMTLFPSEGAVAFVTGGNVCNAVTANKDAMVIAIYDGASRCWRLK